MTSTPWFARHLAETGETYLTHAAFALRVAALCALAATAITVHAVLPFLFETTGSRLLARIDAVLKARRAPAADGSA